MRKKVVLGIIIPLMLGSAQVFTAQADPPPGYTLAFDEEFDGPLNISPGYGWGPIPPATWIAHTPYAGDYGDAWFTGPGEPNTPSPFSVGNGHLIITAYRDPNAGYHWRSGLIASVDTTGNGFSQALGYFECRMWLPSGVGVWPAFYLGDALGLQDPTQNRAEIDILEEYGDDPTMAYQTVHAWYPDGSERWGWGNWTRKAGMTSGYHIYACLVNTDYIHFYIDGAEVGTIPSYPEATHPLYPMVDLALGGGQSTDNTPNPSHLRVDYVRVYAPPASSAPAASAAPAASPDATASPDSTGATASDDPASSPSQ
jgi:beta-glucanase (GH16 family)